MFAHLLDHFFFSAKFYSEKTKNIIFGVNVFLQLAMFYWFKELAWGIEGPVHEYKHRGWRSVSFPVPSCLTLNGTVLLTNVNPVSTYRAGIYTIE